MLVEGKFVRPLADCAEVHRQAFDNRLAASTILVEAPSGYLLTGCLAALLEEQARQIIWLRLGPEDVDPACCLWSLATAARQVDQQAGTEILCQMQRAPGPLQGWSGLYELSARICAGYFKTPTTWVLEHVHYLSRSPQTLALLLGHFVRLLPPDQQVILTTHERIPVPNSRESLLQLSVNDLSLSAKAAEILLQQSGLDLRTQCAQRAAELAQGRAVALLGLGRATKFLGEPWVEHCLKHSQAHNDSFSTIVRSCINNLDRSGREAVSVLAFLGYDHPAINQLFAGEANLPNGPWAQALSRDWMRPYHLWRKPLKTAVSAGEAACDPRVVSMVAQYLCCNNAILDGVRFLCDVNLLEQAAFYMAQHASQLLSGGFWDTIQNWVELLPPGMATDHPWLLQASAEIKSCSGDLRSALRLFEQAHVRFNASADSQGVIASLLAISATAAWTGDAGKAWGSADGARSLAEAAHLTDQEAWAEFHLACLAARDGNLQQAAAHFRRAAELALKAGEPFVLDCIRLLEGLVGEQQRLYSLRLEKQNAYQECSQAEQLGARRLAQALQLPQVDLAGVLTPQGWFQVPLFFKMPVSALQQVEYQRKTATGGAQLKKWLLRLFPAWAKTSSEVSVEAASVEAIKFPVAAFPPGENMPGSLRVALRLSAEDTRVQPMGIPLDLLELDQRIAFPQHALSAAQRTLTAYLLGGFRLAIEDVPVQKLPAGRSGMLLKVLLFHHLRQLPREWLMEQFWPDADPEMARNRLNVAMSGLRQMLRLSTNDDVILFEDGKYGLSPAWQVWLDVDEFEQHLESARRLEAAGEAQQAIHDLEVAANLYRGDFLQDDPYEEWTVSVRERLRLAYLDALYQLSRHYFQVEQYAACAALCQTILGRDACREDVHCLLMRCYARQNQVPLALRQYQACVEALHQELDVEPAVSTTELYQKIKQRVSN